MTTAGQVSAAIAERLRAAGLEAVRAFERETFRESREAFITVGAKETRLERAGLTDYLGERYDAEVGCMVEVYGLKMQLTAAIEIYMPRQRGAGSCEETAEAVAEALLDGLPEGLRLEELAWGETGWEREYGMFVRRGTARCTAYFTAQADERSAVLSDLILKGVKQ